MFRIVLLFSFNKIINKLILLKVDNLFRLYFDISKLFKLVFLQDVCLFLRNFILDLCCSFRIKLSKLHTVMATLHFFYNKDSLMPHYGSVTFCELNLVHHVPLCAKPFLEEAIVVPYMFLLTNLLNLKFVKLDHIDDLWGLFSFLNMWVDKAILAIVVIDTGVFLCHEFSKSLQLASIIITQSQPQSFFFFTHRLFLINNSTFSINTWSECWISLIIWDFWSILG